MKRFLIISSFVFMQIYAQFAVYDHSYGIDKIDAMLFAPALGGLLWISGGLLWISGICVLGFVSSLIKETEEKK